MGRLVPLLGGGCNLLLGFEGVSQGSVARGLPIAFQALCGGGGVVCLFLGDLIGGGGVFGVFGGGRRGSYGGAAQQGPARVGLGVRG